jgi:hypothetical protein
MQEMKVNMGLVWFLTKTKCLNVCTYMQTSVGEVEIHFLVKFDF